MGTGGRISMYLLDDDFSSGAGLDSFIACFLFLLSRWSYGGGTVVYKAVKTGNALV